MSTHWLTDRQRDQLHRHLDDLPELGALAVTCIQRERLGEPGPRAVPNSKPPLGLDAAALTGLRNLDHPTDWPRGGGIVWTDARKRVLADDELPGSILSVLASWTRLIDAEMGDARRAAHEWPWAEPAPLADVPTVSSECGWLARHLLWIGDQQWSPELADDVRRLANDCRRVLRDRPVYHPRCPGCQNLLDDDGGMWSCPSCGSTYRDGRLGLRTSIVKQEPMTVGELVRAFGWSAKTVESWVGRGQLQPADPDAKPRRYHVMDAVRLADANGARSIG